MVRHHRTVVGHVDFRQRAPDDVTPVSEAAVLRANAVRTSVGISLPQTWIARGSTLAVALVSLWLPFANYGFHHDLIGGDAGAAWALPAPMLRQLIGVFVGYPGLGLNASEGIQALPVLGLAALLHLVGLSTAVVARLMIALYLFVAMSGAQCLGRTLLQNERSWLREAVVLSGALFYGMNLYLVHVFGTAQSYFPLGYIALPWMLYGVIVGCERDARVGIALVALAVALAGGVAMNPAFFGVALLVVPIGALLMLAQSVSVKRVAMVCGFGLLFGLGLCAWWVFPAPTGFGGPLSQLSVDDASAWVQWMSQRSSFLELFKLSGYVGGDTIPYAGWYDSPLGSLLGYVPLLVGIAGIGVVRRRLSAVALSLLAASIFLAKGVHAPAATLYQALIDHVPAFSIFRSPYDKWAQLEALFLTIVYVLGFAGLCRRLGVGFRAPVSSALLVACAALPTVLFVWPAFAGRILQAGTDPFYSFTTSLPRDYFVVGDYLRQHAGDSRALVLGTAGPSYAQYRWGYFGEDPLPIIAGIPIAASDVIPRAAFMPSVDLERAMDALGVRYIVIHDDITNPQPTADIAQLVAANDARFILKTPSLRLYERPGGPSSLVSVPLDAALVVPRPRLAPAALDPLQTAQFVPNIGPQVAAPSATMLLVPAISHPQPGDASLGRAVELDSAAVSTTSRSALGII
ncbi:MAG: hypothetical protein JO043_01480, partial [Candidatus Eremiobacteraeota bacterium]|nr:hypothetical protein [Candidatus Eremiobacteraeota bacterium]